ncbi:MAG: M1 family metallopeptidase [Gemmatimonadales bacterium]|nr:M1 family metallopeptidase [Gemmatimonadales bacterium]
MIAPALLLSLALQGPTAGAPLYWQQRLEYDITATLDEPRGTLGGTQRVLYHNNSPDTLRTVSFHLYLNAFRPGSRWAAADSAEKRRRFNDLKDPDYAFNHVRDVTIDGRAVEAIYPFAPDSTIVRFTLPRAVAPGEQFTVSMGWDARPSTLPRRQGRRGRAYDFAQWYPRVVAYDRFGWAEQPLYPAGEFYGDFGDFRVLLDVPDDQVIGATGVPVCGDPGWERVNRVPARPVDYRRDAYGAPRCDAIEPAAAGRKRMLWEAKDVHHFAMSLNAAYRYEGGRYGGVSVHVLYQPGDDRTWGGGVAVRNTETALRWLDELFGPFPWPQITNVHRIEGGGTEFPMMVHDGSAGLGLILHEVGHNYLMGILANNEWKEGFLDEGFTSFQTTWYQETQGNRTGYPQNERTLVLSDLDGWSEPTSFVSDKYNDFSTYNRMIYNRGELFYHQLRTIVGDSTMRQILRTYYQRWKLKHVDEHAFRAVAEEVSKRDLSTFFAQFLHTTVLYDYRVGKVKSTQNGTGGWTTRVEVIREAPGQFPVDLVVRSRSDSAITRVEGIAEREWVEVTTQARPREVELDPHTRAHDWNMLNNRKGRGLLGFGDKPRTEVYLDKFFSQPTRRDRRSVGLAPTIWYNEAGGVTIGGRARTDYLGRFEQNTMYYSVGTRKARSADGNLERVSLFARFRNPTALYRPRTTQTFDLYFTEGRAGVAMSAERQTNQHRSFGPTSFGGGSLRWLTTTDTDFLDPALWENGGTVEGSFWYRSSERRGPWTVSGKVTLGGGLEYRDAGVGVETDHAYDAQGFFRGMAEATARRNLGAKASMAIRLFGGIAKADRGPIRQRRIFLAGADPYERFGNPFLQSRGSLLAGADVHYHSPGGAGVRGLAAGAVATQVVSVNAELDRSVLLRSRARLFNDIRVALFGDAAYGNGDIPRDGKGSAFVADAGAGVRIGHRVGQTTFVTRFDFPIFVSRPRLAVNETESSARFRWVVSFSPAF